MQWIFEVLADFDDSRYGTLAVHTAVALVFIATMNRGAHWIKQNTPWRALQKGWHTIQWLRQRPRASVSMTSDGLDVSETNGRVRYSLGLKLRLFNRHGGVAVVFPNTLQVTVSQEGVPTRRALSTTNSPRPVVFDEKGEREITLTLVTEFNPEEFWLSRPINPQRPYVLEVGDLFADVSSLAGHDEIRKRVRATPRKFELGPTTPKLDR